MVKNWKQRYFTGGMQNVPPSKDLLTDLLKVIQIKDQRQTMHGKKVFFNKSK